MIICLSRRTAEKVLIVLGLDYAVKIVLHAMQKHAEHHFKQFSLGDPQSLT